METPSNDRAKGQHQDTPFVLKRNRRQRDELIGNKPEDPNDLLNFQELKELKMKQLGILDRFTKETKEAIQSNTEAIKRIEEQGKVQQEIELGLTEQITKIQDR